MDMKDQRFGIEVELTGITREAAAKVASEYFGSYSHYDGTYYDTYSALDSQGRSWKFMSDANITPQKKYNSGILSASSDYKTERVSPICHWDDIERVQELVRKLREMELSQTTAVVFTFMWMLHLLMPIPCETLLTLWQVRRT